MWGQLPRVLEVNGAALRIRAGYGNILRIFSAFNDKSLTDREKMYILLHRIYPDFRSIPQEEYPAAYEAAVRFIECNEQKSRPGPRLVDWEKDEQLIFPAINAVAGREVRESPDMHWWTFLGYFQSIDPESLWGTVLVIRQKRTKHRKLEKHEQAFYNANRALCELVTPKEQKKAAYDYMDALYKELRKEGGS